MKEEKRNRTVVYGERERSNEKNWNKGGYSSLKGKTFTMRTMEH